VKGGGLTPGWGGGEQGPPGTGKSFVGARIARLLLAQRGAAAVMGPLLVRAPCFAAA
jgi:hypothetical protein